VLLLFILLLLGGAWAQEPSPDLEPTPRPPTPQKINTADPAAINPGQVKIGITYFTSNGDFRLDANGRPRNFVGSHNDQFLLKLTVGLVDEFDLAVQGGEGLVSKAGADFLDHPTHGAGANDVQFTGRWRFVHEDDLQIAYTFGPTISAGTGAGPTQLAVGQGFTSFRHALVTKQDYDPFTLNLELFHSFPLIASPRAVTTLGFNAAAGWQATDWLQPSVEVNLVRTDPTDVQSIALTGGFVIQPADNIVLLLGVQRVLLGRNTDQVTRGTFGFQIKF